MLPSQKDIELPLLEVLEKLGGKGSPEEISLLVAKKFPQITDADLKEVRKSGANKWKNINEFVRNTLKNKGELDGSVYGTWQITEKGKKRLRYLFSWDSITRYDNLRLKEFLKQKFGIDWVKTAKIEKIDNGQTIKISTEKNYFSLKLNDEKTEVTLEINDGRTDKFVVEKENNRLNVYLKPLEPPIPPPTTTELPKENPPLEVTIDEPTMVRGICRFIKNKGFTFPLNQIINYYLSLKTKPFVILTGISGTGKTKITELFAKAVCEDSQKQYLLLPVRPDWNDDKYLLGYYNPLTKKYQSTPFLEFIMQAEHDRENPYFVCLDEMNLARVEYYFSTFLSAMESNKKIKLHSETDIKTESGKEISSEIEIPPNLFFTGTVNMDETTYRFSPKVLDRANTIEFTEIELLKPRENENSSSNKPDLVELFKRYFLKDEVRTNGITSNTYRDWENKNWKDLSGFLDSINKDSLEKSNLHFGYRIRDEILRYVYFAEKLNSSDFTTEIARDFQIKQKILPRIKGPESIRLALESLREKLADKYPLSSTKINQMLEALQNGYTDFYQ